MADVIVDDKVRQIIEQARKAAETDPAYLIDMLNSCGRK